ncbi:hypothetical protein Q1695_005580 [Nippostrongylus brasiliensis]|nr:hypothetical protein Q1695_005580 [Nippostrongylus brasiliensis]
MSSFIFMMLGVLFLLLIHNATSAGLHVKFHYGGYSAEQDYDDTHGTDSGKGFNDRVYGEYGSFKYNGQEEYGNGKEERSFYESSSDDRDKKITNEGQGKKLGQAHTGNRGGKF